MQSQDSYTQLTFHYADGRTESYKVYDLMDASEPRQEIQQQMRRFFDKPWWILHLPDETVFIHTANVIKVEMKPPLPQLQGEDVFSQAQRVTALTRGARM